MALEDLLGTMTTTAFFERHFPDRHLTVHGSLDRLPSFFYQGVLADPDALSAAYRGPVYVTNRNLGRYQVHGIETRACFAELGLSVGFTEVENLAPGAKEWLHALEQELGMPRGCATMAVFVNGRNSGLSVHCDAQEQIAIHLMGPKAFRVQAHPTRFPKMQHVPGRETPPHWLAQSDGLLDVTTLPEDAEHIELRPGSVLYTPRGLYHETLSGDALAMTAVVAFRNPTPAELLTRYLENVLLQSEDWRRPLAHGWSAAPGHRDAAKARMDELVAQLVARLGGLSTERLLASAEAPPLEPGRVLDTTRLKRDPSTHVALTQEGDRVRVTIATALGTGAKASLSLPSSLQPALAWIERGRRAFDFAELCSAFPAWERSALASTVALLLRTKALVELPFEAW